ncbi:hypothetical protein K227x_02700 [Rubripirellula lacrimiformis]|uniref:DUF1294 domain-containing protein n=1 Tax=Rubripirellula lacrimiformis TaxID=1930273 RepID=A0A517N437_9BACT|nr:DUF1294 domain-containing protein [Rubripirellula lacrimiformis]QDT01901.1 hypothetical protein K227x_02700 [Rubripirellula lacrimiformis]
MIHILAVLAVWTLLASLIASALYAKDKRAARLDQRRTPEQTLLLWCVLGGWPGAWITGQKLRHKTYKMSYRIKFAVCVVVHIAAVATILWSWYAGWAEMIPTNP